MKEYWLYDQVTKWQKIERPHSSDEEWEDFLKSQDYQLDPDFVIGDEFNFLALYEHPAREEFIIHLCLDDFSKVVYTNSFPGLMQILPELNNLLCIYFRTCAIIDGMERE